MTTETDQWMALQLEVALVKSVIEHPAGYDLDLFGGVLTIHTCDGPMSVTEKTVEVEWELPTGPSGGESFPWSKREEAAAFFVRKRHELHLGIDYETYETGEAARDWRPAREDDNFPQWVVDAALKECKATKWHAHPPYTDVAIDLLENLGMWPWNGQPPRENP